MKDTYIFLEKCLKLGYCLHGSRKCLDVVEPRQARCKTGREASSQNAVYASKDDVRVPCIKAMLEALDPSCGKCLAGYSADESGKLVVQGANAVLCPGYVHVLPTDSFAQFNDEFVSYEPVYPVAVYEVTPRIVQYFEKTEIYIPYAI